jgi:ubiquinone/menaquinone biosynthesis C-methylase UbiE
MDATAAAQRKHYNKIAKAYVANLNYPHTQEYMAYLDRALEEAIGPQPLGVTAELCCGHGEALQLLTQRISRYVGVDVSENMLIEASRRYQNPAALFVHGDVQDLPLADASLDTVIMLGGIHHVPDRKRLFSEIARVLKPGGRMIYREPVSDLVIWRVVRSVVYWLSPMLDADNERPLTYQETVPVLEAVGLRSQLYSTHGFVGFCLFMNSDVLFFNRFFRFLPGIRTITRAFARLDRFLLSLTPLERWGLQVIGVAAKGPVIAT